ncbi:follicle-stimulating hormone receptor-like [Lycorma delicatula]|uniref:follicle-stimulating hormone receptor-like n=1 Tax=Lycorma delicatula TaxID=130591 RepID=UPI003F518BC7
MDLGLEWTTGFWKVTTAVRRLSASLQSHTSSVRRIDLSQTAITQLPTSGLKGLDVLRVERTKTLKVFPSIYNFDSIKEVWLTYSCHCCAFHFPAQHDSLGYQKHQEILKRMTEECTNHQQLSLKFQSEEPLRHSFPTLPSLNTDETFHQIIHFDLNVKQGKKIHSLCGNMSKNYNEVKCSPKPDAFNPCEDLMGNWTLRIAVWIVAVSALLGNFAVLLVLISSRFRMTVPKFLMCNLALADLCMGVYLLLIAIMDARSIGYYFNHAIDWQSGPGCQLAGFLTVFSSELSIFTLTVITSERWYTITYAIHLNRRLKLSTAAKIMILGWIYSITMAVFPFFGVSSYSKTSICLPMENSKNSDLAYLVTLLVFNGLAFCIICTCYGRMYCSIKGGQVSVAPVARSDMRVAKRMALLVFTDFACWAPIAFFGLTALAGYPLIDVPKTKILLVFFYPLNSCANPYLYALLTQQYRRDMFILLSRYGICSKKAAQYKGMNGPGGPRTGMGPIGGCATVGNNNAPAPNHRGSVLTSQTSFDCYTRPGSLSVVPEVSANKQLEIISVVSIQGLKDSVTHSSKDRDENFKSSSLL